MKLYEVEKCKVYHLLRKVTERHIQYRGHNKMKFSVAAQGMNSTVAGAISSVFTVGKDNSTVSLNDT
jgi:hypothetical protein